MVDSRVQLLRTAFQSLGPSLAGAVPLETLRSRFDAKRHPDVQSGKRTQDEVLREFLECCDIGHDGEVLCHHSTAGHHFFRGSLRRSHVSATALRGAHRVVPLSSHVYDGFCDRLLIPGRAWVAQVSFGDFFGFYNNISPLIDDDNFFQIMVWNSWNLGGTGARSTGTPLKVIISYRVFTLAASQTSPRPVACPRALLSVYACHRPMATSTMHESSAIPATIHWLEALL